MELMAPRWPVLGALPGDVLIGLCWALIFRIRGVFSLYLKTIKKAGARVAWLVEYLTLGFGSGGNLRVMGLSPRPGRNLLEQHPRAQ